LRKIPEPSDEQKTIWLTALGDLPFLLRRACQQASKELPHKPGGAPSKFQTPEKKKQACEDVGRLLSLGCEKPDALAQVGRKYSVSPRTMRRAWAEHCKSAEIVP
jgi:hypothetical protein